MAKLKEYLKDESGKPSSTRLFSYYILWLFLIINASIFLSVLFSKISTLDINTLVLIIVLDFILLVAIFVPKQLAKMEEIRKIIELAKTGTITMNEVEITEEVEEKK